MASLMEQIDEGLKTAMKSGDKTSVSTLRMVKAAMKNSQIDKGRPLDDAEIIDLLMTLGKQRRESIALFEKGGRHDLAEQEGRELVVLQSFLPEQLGPDELADIVRETIRETGAAGPKDMGLVMKAIKPKVAGKAEGKQVSEVVKKLLG